MSHRSVVSLQATLVGAIAGFVLLASAGTPAPRAAAAPQIAQSLRARSQQAGHVRVIVELKLTSSVLPEARLSAASVLAQRGEIGDRAARVLSRLSPGSQRLIHRFQTVPYLALDVTPSALDALELDSDVVRVIEDKILKHALADSVPLIEGDTAWASGYDGTGTTIAQLDSGVDSTHPFLAGKVVEEACYSSTVTDLSESFCPNGLDEQLGPGSAVPCSLPDCIHGTHVAGIAAGHDPGSNQAPGVAKGAHLMEVQVFSRILDSDSCGGSPPCPGAFTSDIIAGMEHVYAVALAGTQNIVAVNLSLGGDLFDAPCDDQPYKPIIDNLRAIGIPSVIAAGNDSYPFALASPACISSAVSVGASTKTDDVSIFSDVAYFLSLLAPGEDITSSIPGGGYESLSGTSMAAPHVSGAWAVIKQAVPNASVSTVLNALRTTGLPITDMRFAFFFGPGETVPRIRVFEALASLVPLSNPAPIISTISPTRARATLGGVSLEVTGSGFIGSSVVQWNGNPRATKFVSSSKLEATIPGTDLPAAGTAQVTVATPTPGGGTSAPLTFTIDPPPILTPNAAVVGPGDAESVTLVNGLGGESDWIGLAATGAPDNSYLQWTWVGAGVTTFTWNVVMPTTGGTYEFRLFVNEQVVARSPAVTVDASLHPVPVATSLSPTKALSGGPAFTLTVTGSNFIASSVVRWNGNDRPTTFVSSTQLQASISTGDIGVTGSPQVTVFTPAPRGGTSAALPFTVIPPPTITVSATSVAPGASVTATLAGGLGGSSDWMSLAAVGTPDSSYLQWTWVGSNLTTRTWTVTMPTTPGNYEFRLMLNNSYTHVSLSPTVSVVVASLPPPILTVNTSSAPPGGSVTMHLAGGFGGPSDWLSLALVGSSDNTYVQWTWVGSNVTTRDWTVVMPTTPGNYEFRFFPNNTYTHLSVSPPVSVTVVSLPPPTLTVNTQSVAPGGPVTMHLAGGFGGGSDYLTLASVGSPDTTYVQWTWVGSNVTTRDWSVVMPTTPGNYEFRFFPNNANTHLSVSPPVTVTAAAPPPPTTTTLTVNTTSVTQGGSVTVTLTGGFGGALDYISLAAVGSPNSSYLQYTWVGSGITTRTWTVTMPTTAGNYEFRFFPNNTYNLVATSPTVTVTAPPPPPPPVFSLSTTSVARGGTVTVTVTGCPGGGNDWIGLFAVGAPDTNYLQYTWVGGGVTTKTWVVTMPTTPGNYEFRFYLNGNYVRISTSGTVTVGP